MENEKEEKVEIIYPKRPKRESNKDNQYQKMRVICNMKRLNLGEENKQVQQYAIHYEPVIAEDNYPLKRKIIRQLSGDLKGYFERYVQAGDTIFVFSKGQQEKISLETKINEILYKVSFERTLNKVNCRNINKKTKDNIKIKNLIENIVKNIFMANNNIIRFDNRSFYDYSDEQNFGINGNKIWHGYATAVNITESGLFLRINDKNRLITGKTVLDKMKEFEQKHKNIRVQECIREISEYFVGKTVIAGYGNYRAYKIGEISFDRNVKNTSFEIEKEGKKQPVTIKEYYKQQYNINIKDEEQPILIEEIPRKRRGEENKIIRYLIPELCFITGLDELNENDRSNIVTRSQLNPNEKVKKIEKGFSYLKRNAKKKIKKKEKDIELKSPNEIRLEWGINIGNYFEEVEAFCLPVPQLEFGNNTKEVPQLNNGRFSQKKDFNPVHFDANNCMLITFENLVGLAKTDCEQMETAGKKLGVNFALPRLEKLFNKKEEALINDLSKINYNNGKKVAIVVLDKGTKNLYPIIKNYLYTQGGITSQFMLHKENPKFGKNKKNLSYYSCVLNQIVVKVKGELFKINFTEKISNTPSMIIGIDSKMGKEGKKYVLSASFNRSFNKFYTDYKTEKDDENALGLLMKSALDYFYKSNHNNLPKTIIIYRQGGNEKQTEKIMRFELPKMIKIFEEYKENYKPYLTIFGVNKKTDLKFFERTNEGYRNIKTGTVIDKGVISPDVFEFYLQCPVVNRGTGSPVHFLCLYNNNEELTINDFEEITYRQSYYYWNFPGPIRIPAALKYAEVANNFCGKNIKGNIIENLKDSPYFI